MLNQLRSPKTNQKSKRLGRGMSSGVGGHTVGRGGKGATARTGYKAPRPGFEGGQNPLFKRLPKLRGEVAGRSRAYFQSKVEKVPLKLSEVAALMQELKENDVTVDRLVEGGLIRPKFHKQLEVKILLDEPISYKLNVVGIKTSASAKSEIEKNGGSVQ